MTETTTGEPQKPQEQRIRPYLRRNDTKGPGRETKQVKTRQPLAARGYRIRR